jgi:hypothetical protein
MEKPMEEWLWSTAQRPGARGRVPFAVVIGLILGLSSLYRETGAILVPPGPG